MFVKICGITRPADAIAAVDAGADAIGLNFVPTSHRFVDIGAAEAILAVVPDRIMTIGVFRGYESTEVLEITDTLGLDGAQLHHPSPQVTADVAAGVETLIVAVAAESPAIRTLDEHAADIILLDGPVAGSGAPFDWAIVGDLITKHKILLAGGLRPENVAEAIRQVKPWGVDVASGVEAAPARNNSHAIARFVAEARAAARTT